MTKSSSKKTVQPGSNKELIAIRNKKVIEEIKKGRKLVDLEQKFEISRERIRQIVVKSGVDYQSILSGRRKERYRQILREVFGICKTKGCILTYDEFSKKFNSSRDLYSLICKEMLRKGFKKASRSDKEKLIQHLLELKKSLGHTPGIRDISKAGKHSHMMYYYNFGSLTNAQKAAGMKPNKVGVSVKPGK